MGSPKPGHSQSLAEDELVERIREALRGGIEGAGPDLSDDAATLEGMGDGSLLVSVDSVVEGVHFDLALCRPADVGWKALMGALSDLAAMGARPLGALVALCAPPDAAGSLALGVTEGLAQAADTSGCPVVGGDVSVAAQLVVTVTVLGTTDGGGPPVPRSGARVGDVVLVTGPCGRSAAGLRELREGSETPRGEAYRRPVARLSSGQAARAGGAHAMIDVSDGMALDLHRLADASALGFSLTSIPVADGATFDEAVGGGEDYELLITAAAADLPALLERFSSLGLPQPIAIGVMTADADTRVLNGSALQPFGWQHGLASGS